MDVTVGNTRRKKAAAAMLAQMQARLGGQSGVGAMSGGIGGQRVTGGLGRSGARAGMLGGQGRGIPAGLEGLYARASDFARSNLIGDQGLVAEQQAGAVDPGVNAGSNAAANAPGVPAAPVSAVGDPGAMPAAAASAVSGPYVPPQQSADSYNQGDANPYGGTAPTSPDGLGQTQTDLAQYNATSPLANQGGIPEGYDAGAAPSAAGAGAPQDGQPMNGGIYYQGTIIPMGVWRAIQQGQ